jgi:alpha-amylase
LRHYTVFDIGSRHDYEDVHANNEIMCKVADKCYLPMNALLLELVQKYKGEFKISFSISGVALEQFMEYAPQVIQSFKALAQTGCVEFLDETHTHALSFLYSEEEFKAQVKQHRELIKKLFGQSPTVFRNTELVYCNSLAAMVESLGYEGILGEGADHVLGWRSPNFVYQPVNSHKLKLLLRNYSLSDDIAFRFSNRQWPEFPLTAEKFATWAHASNATGEVINLFMDYETFGEHQWESTGIFDFMRALPEQVLAHPDFCFKTPTEIVRSISPTARLDVEYPVSWADAERDLTAWQGNDMQMDAFESVYNLGKKFKRIKDKETIRTWRRLQTSDHFYYMCTKWFTDGDVHKYFNPYGSPYEAYINYMNVLADFEMVVKSKLDE